jgi:hypothetical protein
MGAKVKSIAILGDTKLVINERDRTGLKAGMNFATSVLGFNVSRLNVRLEFEGGPASGLPDKIPAQVRFRAPGAPKPIGAATAPDAKFTLHRAKPGLEYRADLPLTKLLFLMKQDTIPEVATVVREGGTSDKKFRDPLIGASWNSRGTAIQPDKGKANLSGDLRLEQPDAYTLIKTGGVKIFEISIPAGSGIDVDPDFTVWAFIRSPADIFFYSGHGLLTTGQLARSRGLAHDYEDWLSAEDLLKSWRRAVDLATSPIDLDAFIINGCSVLFWNHKQEDGADRRDIGLPWAELLYNKQGPLMTILGYRYRAPADQPMGNKVAEDMAKAIAGGLGTDYDRYAQVWLEINSKIGGLGWGAAAYDLQGYWYINTLAHEGAGGAPIKGLGYDSSKPNGAIMGPFKLP